ncbi:alkaline phosphatase family protein [Sphingomonas sp.]|uniref:alkaline phosphatase family protein n=1 Tax=Sphingomonas sp. TaxID=28214 RepID=UPI001D92600A|nr:alkaline phosphatase family protein [Sphingomonas sp.]MBX9795964.1 alkaline phosphatase family protein [Sphingomonas sp.]
MNLVRLSFAALATMVTAPALPLQAQTAPAAAPAAAPTPAKPPRLIVVISVDQFSADLFAEYRNHFSGGFKRLLSGVVFPSAYQSHAATETCPGHSTLLTGMHPARTGIIANSWTDLKAARTDKTIYCAEDERVAGSNSVAYTVSDTHLLVPTLGERMKAANPATRTVSVAGKDRAAVMMGGHKLDEIWWWDGKKFASYAGRAEPLVVTQTNQAVTQLIARESAPLDEPDFCKSRDRAIPIGAGKSVGTGRFARAAGDTRAFRASPESDGAVFALAAAFVQTMKLGQGPATDIITIGASATDYVGHSYGTNGNEMCLQLAALDGTMGDFFAKLDELGIDYEVALSADHGGHDLPERLRDEAVPDAQRIDPALTTKAASDAVAARLKLTGQLLFGDSGSGDVWIDPKLTPVQRTAVLKEALAFYRAQPQVAAAFSRAEIEAAPAPTLPPPAWSLVQRARASFHPARSGDIVVALKPNVTPIADPTRGYVATHGSFWDYDRRVPLLFWRKGISGFEQPLPVETVDIAPTLAATIGMRLATPDVDGRCLRIDASMNAELCR